MNSFKDIFKTISCFIIQSKMSLSLEIHFHSKIQHMQTWRVSEYRTNWRTSNSIFDVHVRAWMMKQIVVVVMMEFWLNELSRHFFSIFVCWQWIWWKWILQNGPKAIFSFIFRLSNFYFDFLCNVNLLHAHQSKLHLNLLTKVWKNHNYRFA